MKRCGRDDSTHGNCRVQISATARCKRAGALLQLLQSRGTGPRIAGWLPEQDVYTTLRLVSTGWCAAVAAVPLNVRAKVHIEIEGDVVCIFGHRPWSNEEFRSALDWMGRFMGHWPAHLIEQHRRPSA